MILVFTDLDGTLLDHETYAYTPALPAIYALKVRSVPIILASSKTEAEMRPLSNEFELDAPMIVENGAGIVGLDGNRIAEPCYDEIRSTLDSMPTTIRASFEGFGDWSRTEISNKTGLLPEAAGLAAQRQFSEPGTWSGTEADLDIFLELLGDKGFQAVRGGRFLTVMPMTSKADAMVQIRDHYVSASGAPVKTVAFGDAPNDVAMLEAADHGMIISNPAHVPLPPLHGEREGRIWRSAKPGPEGWNELACRWLKDLERPQAKPQDGGD